MVNSIGSMGGAAASASASSAVGALNGRIRDDKMKLDDWTTCVSAKTVKGQAEIQRLSGQISAEREAVLRAQAAQTTPAASWSARPAAGQPSGQHGSATRPPTVSGSLLDVWA
jgi:uncharacterized caspase-like protein